MTTKDQAFQNEEKEMSFIDHLEELRWHLLRSIIAIGIIMIGTFAAKSFVFGKVILGPTKTDFFTYKWLCQISQSLKFGEAFCFESLSFTITNIDMAGQFLIHLKSSFIIGFILAFPYVFWEVWKFVKPGLYENEKKMTRGIVLFSSFFFFAGILFGYFVLSPFSINFLGSYFVDASVRNDITLGSYVGTLSTLVLASGIIFELPMVVYILAKLDIITSNDMRKYRKHALVAIFVLAAVLTPPDPTSQMLIGIPLYFLYEFSILIAKRVNPRSDSKMPESAV